MFNKKVNIVVLAAGKGIRMCSKLPKVMHFVGGKPMIQHVLDTIIQLNMKCIYVVYSLNTKDIINNYSRCMPFINWVLQDSPCGTGHAVLQVLPFLPDDEEIMVLYGDVPLITIKTLKKLLSIRPNEKNGIGLLTATLTNPRGYGRVVRNCYGKVIKIIEDKDVDQQQSNINEINTGVFVTNISCLKRWLHQVTDDNLQDEFYLTDIINIAWKEGCIISTIEPDNVNEIKGVNNVLQLVEIERLYQEYQVKSLSLSGVMFADLNRFDLRGNLSHGQDVYIDTNVIIEGSVLLGNRVVIGTGCVLKDSIVGDDVKILPYSILEGTTVESNSSIGPFARLRSGSKLQACSQIGNFVEIKNTHFGQGSRVNHFSYIGDADVGVMVNIGAGTITCNYDGVNKHKTIIGDNVFIGAGAELVAPVTVSKNAIIGAGTTVTQDVSEGETVISRIRQFVIKR